MNDDTIQKLATMSAQLNARALAISSAGDGQDTALLMSALAVTMEAVLSIGETVNQMNGPKGLGAAGD